MSAAWRRLKPRDTGTIDGIAISPQNSSSGSGDLVEKVDGKSTARDVPEVETNRKLSVFEKAHRWDPNLDSDQLYDIDDAINQRDPKAEGKVFDEVFENSPYPEVRYLP